MSAHLGFKVGLNFALLKIDNLNYINETMTPEQIALVQSNFKDVAPIADQAATLFYKRLFEIAPQVRPLFKDDISDQGKKLMTMIGVAVRGLDKLETIVPAVQSLGRSHVGYGVTEEHFKPVGSALLWTLEVGLGDTWSKESEVAWTEAYNILATTMVDAMNVKRKELRTNEDIVST